MAIWKFRYRQFFGKSGWSVKKWLDRYQMLQPHADAWKGPAYQIIAWSVRNCQSYPIFSLLVGRSVGGVARPQFFLFCSPKTWQEHPTYVPEHIADISETKIENWFSSTILMTMLKQKCSNSPVVQIYLGRNIRWCKLDGFKKIIYEIKSTSNFLSFNLSRNSVAPFVQFSEASNDAYVKLGMKQPTRGTNLTGKSHGLMESGLHL